jgi:4-amino-4-deoxy-L-arabinose transferase-like glycosyltransferase
MNTTVIMPLRHDAGNYFMYAYNLRHKHTYSREIGNLKDLESPVIPDAVRSPGYPLFIAPFVDGLPDNNIIDKILIFQAIISGLTIILAFFLFRSFLPVFWGGAASLLVALSPHLIAANSFVLTETLFCFLIVLFAWLISLFGKNPPFYLCMIIGVIMGIASLVRPSLQYFFIPLTFLLIFHYGWRKGVRFSFVVLLGFVLVFGPWLVRNIITLGIATDKTLMINFLHHGMYPTFTFENIEESYGLPYRHDPRSKEISKDLPSVIQEITRRFDQEPLKHVKWFLLGKPVSFWSWDIVNGAGDIFPYPVKKSPYFNKKYFWQTHELMYNSHWHLVIFCFLGSFLVWFPLSVVGLPQDSIFVARFISLLLIYYTLMHMVGAPFPRYSIPLRPFLYGMAVFTPYLLVTAIRKFREF